MSSDQYYTYQYLPTLEELEAVLRYVESNDEHCLELIWQHRYGKGEIVCPACKHSGRYVRKVSGNGAAHNYRCPRSTCRYEINPLANTIFDRSHVSLLKWFEALYLIQMYLEDQLEERIEGRYAYPIPELARRLVVSYPSAKRIQQKIIREIYRDKLLTINNILLTMQLERKYWPSARNKY